MAGAQNLVVHQERLALLDLAEQWLGVFAGCGTPSIRLVHSPPRTAEGAGRPSGSSVFVLGAFLGRGAATNRCGRCTYYSLFTYFGSSNFS